MKDYANRSFNYNETQQQEKAPIHWSFIIAALVAMAVIYSIWHHRRQTQTAQQSQVLSHSVQAQPAAANVAPTVTATKAVAVAPTKATTQAVKFDFYQMLTEGPSNKNNTATASADNHTGATHLATNAQNTQSQSSSASTNNQPISTNANTTEDVRYYIQVGSYRTKADALQQKANLILTEISPKLIKITGSNGHYRVVIGPYNKLASATAERADLKQNGINGSLIKSSDLKK